MTDRSTTRRALRAGLLLIAFSGCAGGSPTRPSEAPTPPPPTPAPPPVETFSVEVVAFYDENGNAALDSGETGNHVQ